MAQTESFPEMFEISDVRLPPRFNIAPTQDAPVVRQDDDGTRMLVLLRWGLIPSWAKDISMGARMINARSETVEEKPVFRAAFRRRRCLVPADGFFEWRKEGAAKQPYYFSMKGGNPFAFAGLWDAYESPDAYLETYTILTCEANETVEPIHHRMPVILPPDLYAKWLQPGSPEGELKALLRPYPEDDLQVYPVSRMVNSPSNDSPLCIQRFKEGLFE